MRDAAFWMESRARQAWRVVVRSRAWPSGSLVIVRLSPSGGARLANEPRNRGCARRRARRPPGCAAKGVAGRPGGVRGASRR